MPEATFPEVLGRFSEEARLDGTYFLCKQDDMATLARALEKVRRRRCPGSGAEPGCAASLTLSMGLEAAAGSNAARSHSSSLALGLQAAAGFIAGLSSTV